MAFVSPQKRPWGCLLPPPEDSAGSCVCEPGNRLSLDSETAWDGKMGSPARSVQNKLLLFVSCLVHKMSSQQPEQAATPPAVSWSASRGQGQRRPVELHCRHPSQAPAQAWPWPASLQSEYVHLTLDDTSVSLPQINKSLVQLPGAPTSGSSSVPGSSMDRDLLFPTLFLHAHLWTPRHTMSVLPSSLFPQLFIKDTQNSPLGFHLHEVSMLLQGKPCGHLNQNRAPAPASPTSHHAHRSLLPSHFFGFVPVSLLVFILRCTASCVSSQFHSAPSEVVTWMLDAQ